MKNLLKILWSLFSALFAKKRLQPAPQQKPEILEEDWHEGPSFVQDNSDVKTGVLAVHEDGTSTVLPQNPLLLLWIRCMLHMERRGNIIDKEIGGGNIIFVSGHGVDGTKNDNKPNLWNDLCFVARMTLTGWDIPFVAECTTAPGTAPSLAKDALERGGIARIVPGQYIAWKHGHHKPVKYGLKHPAFRQCKVVSYTRDFDQNQSPIGDKVYSGLIYVNIHAQHEGKDATFVNFNSEGCLVLRRFDELQMLLELSKDFNIYKKNGEGTIFAATIIEGSTLPA